MKQNNNKEIRVGDTVFHKKSRGTYEIIAFAVHERTEEALVIYQHEGNGSIWARNRDEFMDGRFVKL